MTYTYLRMLLDLLNNQARVLPTQAAFRVIVSYENENLQSQYPQLRVP